MIYHGNLKEWTNEVKTANSRPVFRGGYYEYPFSAGWRSNDKATSKDKYIGYRAALYVTNMQRIAPVNAPTLAITSGTLGNNGWYKSNVGIKVTQGAVGKFAIARTTYSIDGGAETQIANGETISITTDGTHTITAYTYDIEGNKSPKAELSVKRDATAPTNITLAATSISAKTKTSFTITIGASTDATAGLASYSYYVGGALKTTNTSTTCSVTGLTAGNTYAVYVKIADNAGNTIDTNTISVTMLDDVNAPTLTPSGTLSNGWYRSNITVTITAGAQKVIPIQKTTYTVSGPNPITTETTIASGGTISLIGDGTHTITAYTYDTQGNKSPAKTLQVNKDATAPAVTKTPSEANSITNKTATSFTYTVYALDALSGIGSGYNYYLNGAKQLSVPSNSNVFTTSSLRAGTAYQIYATITDNAGNITTTSAITVTTLEDIAIVNAPKISGTGLIPITINESTGAVTEVLATNPNWYKYIKQNSTTQTGGTSKWANAITKNSSGQITGMFVWIPRFAYKITNPTTYGGTIDLVFLNGTTDNYTLNGQTYTARRFSESGVDSNQSYYVVHPCFTKTTDANGIFSYQNGEIGYEVEGIWVAKFEAGFASSSTYNTTSVVTTSNELCYTGYDIENCGNGYYDGLLNNYFGAITNSTRMTLPVFLPKAYSYNMISVANAYSLSTIIKSQTTTKNYYNITSSSFNTHMMKNAEWGAVLYLSHSKYGRNGTPFVGNKVEVTHNGVDTAITGYGGETQTTANEWTGSNGKLASTTGNVYGIYDMNGGLEEFVAWCMDNPSEIQNHSYQEGIWQTYGGGVYNATIKAFTNKYSYMSYVSELNTRGDAMNETTNWYHIGSHFPYQSNIFLTRGGGNINTTVSVAGVPFESEWMYDAVGGHQNTLCGWRIAIY